MRSKIRSTTNCRSYARQSVDGPPSGDGSYEQSDDSFSNRARSISLIVMAIVFTLFISVTSSAADRGQNGLLVRYDFNEGGGNSIHFDMR